MPLRIDARLAVTTALAAFGTQPLEKAARSLFGTLGYRSDRTIPIGTVSRFRSALDPEGRLTDREVGFLSPVTGLHLLFQLTNAELDTTPDLLDDRSRLHTTQIESYLFFAADLKEGQYTRTDLSSIVRAINKPLTMPALVLFRHGGTVSLGIIHRRLNKRDAARDVLEKVTLIKDISITDPIRAHLEILNDFALANLDADYGIPTFVRLHEAWQKRLGSYALSNEFYREIADWYFWAHHQVDDGTIRLPRDCDTEQEQSLFLIRLLTRVIFCWFLVEKKLIPPDLFQPRRLAALLRDFDPTPDGVHLDTTPSYYRAILQNLFFGTLNMPADQRGFREKKQAGDRYDKNYGITNLWRYQDSFRVPGQWIDLARRVPFLNGGLFDCLDDKAGKGHETILLDGFSDNREHACTLPNDLFFGPERTVDLSRDYGEEDKRTARSKRATVRGLVEILSRYKFTIEENTPLEEEIALDPELLGKVFENLLASYNEDTRTTARKALGAFYTPREIVSFMVDEAIKSYLANHVPKCKGALEDLFSNKATLKEIKPDTREALIAAIGRVKILDPACGSGAFPMGALHRLVDLLQKLDHNNESWKRDRLAGARAYRRTLEQSGAGQEELEGCDARIADIEKSFDTRFHALDFARKLYLIENSIFGIDIQPIATQIAKLRFFISLIVDQKVNPHADNLGVRPLPNLETRLVAADTLIPIEKSESDLLTSNLDRVRRELADIRHDHFNARSPAAKRKCREADAQKRSEIAALLEREHAIPKPEAQKLAGWDPYDQNASAPFFDSEWMFGLPVGRVRESRRPAATLLGNLSFVNEIPGQSEFTVPNVQEVESGFDIVLGNPPYVRQEQIKHLKPSLKEHYDCFTGTADLYVYFFEAGIKLLRPGGSFSFITSNKWFRSGYGEKLRDWLTTNTRVLHLIDFGDAPVFTAIAYPCIITLQRRPTPPGGSTSVRALTWQPGPPIETFTTVFARDAFALDHSALKRSGWHIETGANLGLLDRLRTSGTPLGQYVKDRFYRGILTGLNEAFVVDRATRDRLIAEHPSSEAVLKPFLRGKDVKRWRTESKDLWLLYVPWHFPLHEDTSITGPSAHAENQFRKCYPAVYNHLFSLKSQLLQRNAAETGIRYEWYALQRWGADYWQEIPKSKIIIPAIENKVCYAPDLDGYYSNDKTSILVCDDPLFLLGILNSPVSWWLTQQTFASKQGGYFEFKPMYVSQLPIPKASKSQKGALERIVEYLIYLSRHFADEPTDKTVRDEVMLPYLEQISGGLVYELYFPLELQSASLDITETVLQSKIPALDSLRQSSRITAIRRHFETIYDASHPLKKALDRLQQHDTVRIIEGEP